MKPMVQPTVSILLPVYNGEQYVRQAIRSVLEQSFSGWELIIQDNCSTDGTDALVKQYDDPRIIYSRNLHNLHIAANLNVALLHARGKYIQLLGHDDRLLSDCLRVQVGFMEAHTHLGFSFCAPFVIDAEGNRLMEASHAWDTQYNDTPEVCQGYLALVLLFNYGCLPGNISTVMIRRDCLKELGGFDSSYRICLDWDMWIRLARLYGFGFVKKRLVEIRSHNNQESRNPGRVKDRIVETYRCLALLEDSLPLELGKELRSGRKNRYAVEFMHHAIRAILAGRLHQGIDFLGIIRSRDGILIPFTLWVKELPKRVLRRLLGRGPIDLRAAFESEWLGKQVARGRAGVRLRTPFERDQ